VEWTLPSASPSENSSPANAFIALQTTSSDVSDGCFHVPILKRSVLPYVECVERFADDIFLDQY
jgi:hypothetical protein